MIKKINVKLKESEQEKYPSATILLDIAKNEYNRAREQSNILDNKASFAISASIAVVTILIQIIPFSKFLLFYENATKPRMIIATIAICLLVLATIIFLVSMINLCKCFGIHKHKNVNIENLNDEKALETRKNILSKVFLQHYYSILRENLDGNNKRAENVSIGFKYSLVSIALLYIVTIMLTIVIGD